MEYWKHSIDALHQQHRYFYRFTKRIFDLVASICGLIILSPVFLVIAILIKFDDPHGPIFYEQTRVGKFQRSFEMFKFRSMRVNADKQLGKIADKNEVSGPMFKMKHDPRVTRIGHFIRRYSLDELPQLLNVVLGEMSLVGPRPPLPSEVEHYDAFSMQRLDVLPGCTGLWQIGGRSNVSFDDMVKLDLEYINRCSFSFDLYILIKTFVLFFKPNGAY
ncbi:sugar transferase [Companilactobacillus allii]|uniref:Multidrug MFS transporter n=1 Tax=Companilactobacillus allii TaxID=1847728 RepID=A0A1P8Q2B1_9LACO|nr:sugar transferase [Companilactobacillus allii]APX71975.1 multidrug MFS transporter [Companilactobacillus allii]USQ69070.1 sugar transferase [Companilactobacillus allii]